jgi:inosose dehydratase
MPGWGEAMPPDRVLAEMRSAGLAATELGAAGWLPAEPAALAELLNRHGLRLVAAFVPLVLDDPARADEAAAAADAACRLLQSMEGDVLVSAAVRGANSGARNEPPENLDHVLAMLRVVDEIAGERGLAHAFHPHAETIVESAEDVRRVAEGSAVRWCLDTGHLAIGGLDVAEFARMYADRVAHVHLKDADLGLGARVAARDLSLLEATRLGLFRPLGRGDVPVKDVVEILEESGYEGWYVLEQDTIFTDDLPPEGTGPALDVSASIDYLELFAGDPAPRTR